jgi:hypothetical protein
MILEINASTLDSIQIIKIATDITAFQLLARLERCLGNSEGLQTCLIRPRDVNASGKFPCVFSYPCVRFLHTRATQKYSRVYLCFVGCASHSSAEHLSLLI